MLVSCLLCLTSEFDRRITVCPKGNLTSSILTPTEEYRSGVMLIHPNGFGRGAATCL
jgi:hypothetical protein